MALNCTTIKIVIGTRSSIIDCIEVNAIQFRCDFQDGFADLSQAVKRGFKRQQFTSLPTNFLQLRGLYRPRPMEFNPRPVKFGLY